MVGTKCYSQKGQRVAVLLLLSLALVSVLGLADSYTVPMRDTDLMLPVGFFKRMRDLFAERAYEDAIAGPAVGAGGPEMADEAVPAGNLGIHLTPA
uniref:Uncharacterized protein n=1 Tax=Anopheles albimanus TaxID=7167 RepID=A0A182FH12_ANOAL